MRSRRPLLLVSAIIALLAVLYALAGFMLVPRLVMDRAPQLLEDTGHRLRMAGFRFNPFTLDAVATDLAIEDGSGKPVFAAASAAANVEWTSLLRRAPVLASLDIARPELHVEIDEQGRVNLAALSKDDGKPSSGLPRFYIGALRISDGAIAFADRRERYENRFEQLSLQLSRLSTLNANEGPYTLTAQTTDGAKLQWQGELALQPLALSGTLGVSEVALPALSPYLDAWLAVPLASGRAEVTLPHRFFIQDGRPQLVVENAGATFSDLALQVPVDPKTATRAATPPLKANKLAFEGVKFDLQARQVSAQLLRLEGLNANLQRNADGSLDVLRLMRASDKPAAIKEANAAPSWAVSATRIELAGAGLAFTDAASGLSVALDNIGGQLSGYATGARELAYELQGGVRGGGQVGLRGKLAPQAGGFSGHIEATGLPVALLQPLMARSYRMKLASGEATLAGDIQTGGKDAKFSYSGSASINNVSVNEAAKQGEGTRLLGWKTLATDRIILSLGPDRVAMDELRLVAPVGRLVIAPDRSVNLRRALLTPEEAAADAADVAAAAESKTAAPPALSTATKPGAEPAGFAVNIRRLRVSGGALDFSDESLAQGFNIAIQELAGIFNGLSSDRTTRSQFSLEGRVGEFGFARLSGGLNPFEWRDRTTLRAEFRNIDMARVSPYSIKFAGYRIASGRLSLDLRYRINNNIIEGDNQAVFDQLVLGEKVQSPDALDLPIELAVSLLKDDQGRIDIAVPVTGSLDDPQFDYGALIRKAIGNVISRIVAAPFRALASLFGGGRDDEDVGAIAFEPGQSRLLPPEREKIQRVAQGLEKRAEVKVVVPGRADSEADGNRLRRAALSREISKRAGFEVGEDESAGGVSIDDARTRSAIRDLYAERFGRGELDKQREQAEAAAREASTDKPTVLDRLRNFASGEPQVTNPRPFYGALMRRLRENQPLPQGALEQLAQARAQGIAAALRQAGVAEDRVSTSTAPPTSDAQAKEVKVELSLAKK